METGKNKIKALSGLFPSEGLLWLAEGGVALSPLGRERERWGKEEGERAGLLFSMDPDHIIEIAFS